MSTDALLAGRRGVLLVVGFAVLAPATRAAQVDFRPVLSFGAFHSGNVFLVDYDPSTGQQATPVSDDVAALTFDLIVDRKVPGSTFSFQYQPSYVWYREHSELDYLGNAIALSYAKEGSRRSRISADLGATRSDFQGITASNANRPDTIVPRTTITRVHATVGGSEGVAKRGLVDWQVHGGIDRYDAVSGVVFNNSSSIGARAGWRHELSERSTLGLALDVERIGYDQSADVITETLVLAGTYKLRRSTELLYDVGVTLATSDGLSDTGGVFLVSFTQELSDVSSLNGGASSSVTPGTGLQGSTRDSGAWVSYESSRSGRGLRGSINGAYWYRSGLQFGDTSTTGTSATLNLAGSLGWTFNRYVSLNANYAYVNQNASSVTSDAANALDTSYSSYGVSVRWAIRGR